jgi:hypothetical protein
MTKKLFSTVAAAAVLATSATAFSLIDGLNTSVNAGLPYAVSDVNTTVNVYPTGAVASLPSAVATTPFTIAGRGQQGDALIFPAYFADNAWQTTLKVQNTSSTNAVVAKVVIYAGNDSRELRDFNIYLSANDVWEGTIKIDANGQRVLTSTDGSSPVQNAGMATVAVPMVSEPIDTMSGYIEVIGCAQATTDYHGTHAALRTAYQKAAKEARAISTSVSPIFKSGVINSYAQVPAVAFPSTGYQGFEEVGNVLIGEVRITDTLNGKDMVMPAIKLQDVTPPTSLTYAYTDANTSKGGMGLMFIEGEAANIADRSLVANNGSVGSNAIPVAGVTMSKGNKSEYAYANLLNEAMAFDIGDVYVNYGDSSSLVNNQLILTSPYKRLLVNSDMDVDSMSTHDKTTVGNGVVGTLYAGAVYTAASTSITNWGAFSALALIFDQNENQVSGSLFSPATTPTMNFAYEVSATEGNNPNIPTDNLSYYLTTAQQSGYTKGFVDVRFTISNVAKPVPTIPTQMIATEAAGKVITNWITPEWK